VGKAIPEGIIHLKVIILIKDFSEAILDSFIKESKKLAILCAGNMLLGDDSAGVLVCRRFEDIKHPDIKVFNAYQVPELYITKIVEGDFTHALYIDSVDVNKSPGSIIFLDVEDLPDSRFSTHRIPERFLLSMIRKSKKKIMIIGIQIRKIELGGEISPIVFQATVKLGNLILKYLKKYKKL